jgi:hypothetical protein
VLRFLALLAAAVWLVLAAPATAWAHGNEGPVPARQDVLEAIAYIVNAPDNMDAITDKIKDAQDSDDVSGVDLALVKQAQAAVEANRMDRARDLLQRSIGAAVDVTGTDVRPILHVSAGLHEVALATGEQPGTLVVTNELPGRGPWTSTDTALIALAAALGATGIWLGLRYRPQHRVRELRHRDPSKG